MEFLLITPSGTQPLELLDVSVQNRRQTGQSLLSVRFECRLGRERDYLKFPLLTWLEVNQLQQFTQRLLNTGFSDTQQLDLRDAGLRLTGYGQPVSKHSIRVEPLPDALLRFPPFVIDGDQVSLSRYTRLLSQRLWEAFCRG